MSYRGWGRLGRWFVVSSGVAMLAACGGGGGGGGSGSESLGVRVVNVQASGTAQRVYESSDVPLGSVTITADVSGDLSKLNGRTVYVIVVDTDGLFQPTPSVFISGNGIGNSIGLQGKATQGRAGSYRTPLTVHVCLDAACNQEFDGSPFQVPMQIDVLAGLRVTSASPLVIDLAFGQVPVAVDLPVVLPVDAPSFSGGLTMLPGKLEGALAYEQLPAPATTVRLLPRMLPVGTYTQTLVLTAIAQIGLQPYPLQLSLPVTVNVRATTGVTSVITPSSASVQALSSGSFIPESQSPPIYVLSADGQIYSALSRVQYLPAGGGLADAGGVDWLEVGVNLSPREWDGNFSAFAHGCSFVVSSSCLAPGRYGANVYFRIPGGAELPTPFPVTVDVR